MTRTGEAAPTPDAHRPATDAHRPATDEAAAHRWRATGARLPRNDETPDEVSAA